MNEAPSWVVVLVGVLLIAAIAVDIWYKIVLVAFVMGQS